MPNLDFTGKLTKLVVDHTFVKVMIDSDPQEGSRYFELKPSHPNYDKVYTLMVTAFLEQIDIRLRMEDSPNGDSKVIKYVVLRQVHLPT